MKFGFSMSKCDERLNGGSRKTLRESHGGLSGKGSQPPPSYQPPARHSVPVVRALQKGCLPPPHNILYWDYRYKEGEEEGASGSERERAGARGGAQMTRTQSPCNVLQFVLSDIPETGRSSGVWMGLYQGHIFTDKNQNTQYRHQNWCVYSIQSHSHLAQPLVPLSPHNLSAHSSFGRCALPSMSNPVWRRWNALLQHM